MNNWGPNIWCYLHTYTVSIKDNLNSSDINTVTQHLHNVATNLPCPLCSEHAKKFLNKNKLRNIKNKNDLIKLFIDFHNDVNKRKSKQHYDYNIQEMYKSKELIKVANDYVYTWLKASTSKYLGNTSNFANKLYIKQFKDTYWRNKHLLQH